jgi:hypothetical protein
MREKIAYMIWWTALGLVVFSVVGSVGIDTGSSGKLFKVIHISGMGFLGWQLIRFLLPDSKQAIRRSIDGFRLKNVLDESPTTRLSISAEVRRWVTERDEYTCSYCNRQGQQDTDPHGKPWHIDHVIPVKRGGRTVPQNLTLSCSDCNLSKATKTPVEFMRHRQKQGRWQQQGGAE